MDKVSFNDGFRRDVALQITDQGDSVAETADRLEISKSSLSEWWKISLRNRRPVVFRSTLPRGERRPKC